MNSHVVPAEKVGTSCCASFGIFRRRRKKIEVKRSHEDVSSIQGKNRTSTSILAGFQPSPFLSLSAYRNLRSRKIDESECAAWSVLIGESVQEVDSSRLKSIVRKGVADEFKKEVFLRANNAHDFLLNNPTFYDQTVYQTFGSILPSEFGEEVPTFAGGILGFEEDIEGGPIDIANWEVDMDFSSEAGGADESSDGFTVPHGYSWTDLDPTHFAPNSPQILVSEAVTSKKPMPKSRSGHLLASFKEMTIHPSYRRRTQSNWSYNFKDGEPQFIFSTSGSEEMSPTNFGSINSSKHLCFSRYQKSQPQNAPIPWGGDLEVSQVSSASSNQRERALTTETLRLGPSRRSDLEDTVGVFPSEGNSNNVYRIHQVAPFHHILSEEGIHICKKILWCLNCTMNDLEFCPFLPPLVIFLLCYLDEKETYAVIRSLLMSNKLGNRTRILCRRSEFVRYVKTTHALACRRMPKLSTYLSCLGVDLPAWFSRCLTNGFARILPFNFVLRIYTAFLFEGVKVFQRYSFAFLKIFQPLLLKCTSRPEAEKILSGTGYRKAGLTSLDALSKMAFQLRIKTNSVDESQMAPSELPTAYLTAVRAIKFYRPRLFEQSSIVTGAHWEMLWSWLPQNSRILDPHLVYISTHHGMSLTAIHKCVWKQLDFPMLCFIETTQNEVIGTYSPFPFRTDSKTLTSKDKSPTFVFQLRPKSVAYWWTGNNKGFMTCSYDSLSIGSDHAAFCLDCWVKHGCSKPSASFDSPQLAGDCNGDFVVQIMEIWLLTS